MDFLSDLLKMLGTTNQSQKLSVLLPFIEEFEKIGGRYEKLYGSGISPEAVGSGEEYDFMRDPGLRELLKREGLLGLLGNKALEGAGQMVASPLDFLFGEGVGDFARPNTPESTRRELEAIRSKTARIQAAADAKIENQAATKRKEGEAFQSVLDSMSPHDVPMFVARGNNLEPVRATTDADRPGFSRGEQSIVEAAEEQERARQMQQELVIKLALEKVKAGIPLKDEDLAGLG